MAIFTRSHRRGDGDDHVLLAFFRLDGRHRLRRSHGEGRLQERHSKGSLYTFPSIMQTPQFALDTCTVGVSVSLLTASEVEEDEVGLGLGLERSSGVSGGGDETEQHS